MKILLALLLLFIVKSNVVFSQVKAPENTLNYFRTIANDLIIDSLNGDQYIYQADIFSKISRSNFTDYLDNKKTENITVSVLRPLITPYSLVSLFEDINEDFESLVLTQNQIINFCERYYDNINVRGLVHNFLVKEGDDFYVVLVRSLNNELLIRKFSIYHEIFDEYLPFIVIPN